MADEQIYEQDPWVGDIPPLARLAMDVETYLGSGVWETYKIDGNQLGGFGQFKYLAKTASFSELLPNGARLERIDFAGTGTVKVGVTVGGTEIMDSTDISVLHCETIGKILHKTWGITIYITIVSGTFDIIIDYLPNRFV